jgi:hypothetical protein
MKVRRAIVKMKEPKTMRVTPDKTIATWVAFECGLSFLISFSYRLIA